MINKAISYMEIGEEVAARREYIRIVESFTGDAGVGDSTKMNQHLLIARHALDVLDTVRIPSPEFQTEYLEAQRRRDQREMLRHPVGSPLRGTLPNYAEQFIRSARWIHHATANLVRRSACTGDPIVLLLRNLGLIETSIVTSHPDRIYDRDEPESYAQTIRFVDGQKLVNRLNEITNVVQVASTQAATLEIDSEVTSMLGGSPMSMKSLYLPDAGWWDTVHVLMSLAERIVVWANEKTPGLLQELELITEMGRAEDTIVLLEEHPGAEPELACLGERPPPGEALTPDDPVLTGFPTIMSANDVARDDLDDSPFLLEVMRPIVAVGQLSMDERVARIRRRIDAALVH